MRYWWVNQNQTFRHEMAGGYLWSPKRSANGARNPFYETMREVAPGDLILSFLDTRIAAVGVAQSYCWESPKPAEFGNAGQNWEDIGWRVKVAFTRLNSQVRPKDHIDILRPLLPSKYSPLQANGNGLQSIYLAEIPIPLAEALFGLIGTEVEAIRLQLKASYQQATAAVEGLASQLEFSAQRLGDIKKLRTLHTTSAFKDQEAQVQVNVMTSQLQAAKAAQVNAQIARDAEVEGENPAVAQIKAQLDKAKWELEQTWVRAPSDGYVTSMTMAAGQRATAFRSAMPFLPHDDISIVGLFPPNGFGAIKPGADVTLVFLDKPGQRFKAKVLDIPIGIGQGQIAVSGVLARPQSVGGTTEYPVLISIPEGMAHEDLRLGTPGMATIFASGAGPIGLIAAVLIWVASFTAYL